MTEFVVGFLFSEDHVLLIRKRPGPLYVSGKLNGVGGKIEPGEAPAQAMRREALEEANIGLPDGLSWEQFHTETHPVKGSVIHFFCVELPDGYFLPITQKTDEPLEWAKVLMPEGRLIPGSYVGEIVPNLHYLIPMAAHWLRLPEWHWSVGDPW